MELKIGQLFVRKATALTENTYMVCGLINTPTPLQTEAIHTILGNIIDVTVEDVSDTTRGNGLDGIMTSPLWRLR